MFSPSTAPRWKIVTSTFRRGARFGTARARNCGAKPRLTSASLPFFRKMRLEIMASYLLWNSGDRAPAQAPATTSRLLRPSPRRLRDLAGERRGHQRVARHGRRVRSARRGLMPSPALRSCLDGVNETAKFIRLSSAPVLTHASALSE